MPTPIRQLESVTSYVADGVTTAWNFTFSGGYLDKAHVKAYSVAPTGARTEITVTVGMFLGTYQLSITPPVTNGHELTIYRDTPTAAPLVDFFDRAAFTETSLDTSVKQAVFAAAETVDALSIATERLEDVATFAASAEAAKVAAEAAKVAAEAAKVAAQASQTATAADAAAADADAAAADADAAAADAARIAAQAAAASIDEPTVARKTTGTTGAFKVSHGTTAQRPAAETGLFRLNDDTKKFEGHNGTGWGSVGGGATGTGQDAIFVENGQTVTGSYSIPAGSNAASAGPVSVADGQTVTIPDGSRWVIV